MKVPDLHRWLAAICADPGITPTAVRVGSRLMLHVNSLTGQCNPSVNTLARGCATAPRTVERSIRQLEDRGWISRSKGGGLSSNSYILRLQKAEPEPLGSTTPPTVVTGVTTPDQGDTPTPDQGDGGPPTVVTAHPRRGWRTNGEENGERNGEESMSPQNDDLSRQDRIAPDGFGEFWRAYPLKKSRHAAERAYAKALKGGARAEQILEGARRYGSERAREDPKYTKHPATWLNNGCWDDEALPPGRPPARTTKRDGSRTREALRALASRAGYFDHDGDQDELGQHGRVANR